MVESDARKPIREGTIQTVRAHAKKKNIIQRSFGVCVCVYA